MNTRYTEGIDYYMEEGRLIWTGDYLRKRGYCCNRRCRHCPYADGGDNLNKKEVIIKIDTGESGDY